MYLLYTVFYICICDLHINRYHFRNFKNCKCSNPAGIYLFKVNNGNKNMFKVNNKSTGKRQ